MLRVIEAQGCSIVLEQTRNVFVQNGFTDPEERVNLMVRLRRNGQVSVFQGQLEARTTACGRAAGVTLFETSRFNAFLQALAGQGCFVPTDNVVAVARALDLRDGAELGLYVQIILSAGIAEMQSNGDIELTDWSC